MALLKLSPGDRILLRSYGINDHFVSACRVMLILDLVWPDRSLCLEGRKWASADSSSRVLFTDEG